MARILLLDFDESDYRELLADDYDVELLQTNWKSGRIESLYPPQDCQVVFYQANLGDFGSGLHVGDAESFSRLVEEGGAVVCLIGDCQEYHLTNIIGEIPHLKFEENSLPGQVGVIDEEPFKTIFDQFRSSLTHAFELFPAENSLGKSFNLKEWDPPFDGELRVLAESSRKFPIALQLRKGKGFYLLLPWFGEKNLEVIRSLLRMAFPEPLIAPGGTIETQEETDWTNSPDYVFPGLLEIHQQIGEEKERHRLAMRRLEERIADLRATEQEPFLRLLQAEGAELRQAVIRAFKYLEWINVVDADDYWKHVIRIKEEDIWLIDEDEKSVEELIRTAQILLVNVRSGEGGAADEDCLLLQRYKGRRMQEFDNTKMKALLIGNYYRQLDPKSRPVPFSEDQMAEAARDGNALLTTFELFRAIKAEKEKRITKEAIREQIKTKVGLITFDV